MKNAAASKTVRVENVADRDYVRGGISHPGRVDDGHHVEIRVGESIRLFGSFASRYVKGADGKYVAASDVPYDITFRVGDTAAYDSWNMVYTGTIVAIGEKTVTIQDDKRNRRLSIYEFSTRNRAFDLDAINARNEDVLLHC